MTTFGAHRGSAHLPYLDGWRGLAIVCVLVDHFYTVQRFDSGNFGVDSFFSLSGLLIGRILFVDRVPLDVFYKRRISRILPAFLVFVTTVFGVALLAGQAVSWLEFLSTLTFLRTYMPAEPELWYASLPIGHLWSLNVEEHGYVLLSLLTLIVSLRSRETWPLLLLGTLSVAIELAYHHVTGEGSFHYMIRTEAAVSHLLISAGYLLVRHRVAPFVRPWMPLATFAVAAACYWNSTPHSMAVALSPYLLAFSVNHLGETAAPVRKALAVPLLRGLGVGSYSVYLWQQPFFVFASHLPPGVPLVASLLMGFASFRLLEDPVRRWLNRHW